MIADRIHPHHQKIGSDLKGLVGTEWQKVVFAHQIPVLRLITGLVSPISASCRQICRCYSPKLSRSLPDDQPINGLHQVADHHLWTCTMDNAKHEPADCTLAGIRNQEGIDVLTANDKELRIELKRRLADKLHMALMGTSQADPIRYASNGYKARHYNRRFGAELGKPHHGAAPHRTTPHHTTPHHTTPHHTTPHHTTPHHTTPHLHLLLGHSHSREHGLCACRICHQSQPS